MQNPQATPSVLSRLSFKNALGETQWGITILLWAMVFGLLAYGYIAIRDRINRLKAGAKNAKGDQGNSNNGNYGGTGTSNAGDTQGNYANQSHQTWVNNLKRVNEKTYPLCWGLNDSNERCEVWDNFTKLSDPDQMTIAYLYKNSTNKMLRSDVEAINNLCYCTKLQDSNVKFRLLQNLYRLGV